MATETIELVRPDDLLHLWLEFDNLKLRAAQDRRHPELGVDNPDQPAWLRVIFPPQTIVEGAYFEAAIVAISNTGNDQPAGKAADPDTAQSAVHGYHEKFDPPGELLPPAQRPAGEAPRERLSKIGHSSRLVFQVPPGTSIPFTIEGLLDWTGLTPALNPIAAIGPNPTAAQIAQAPEVRAPHANETALELPFKLVISPNGDASWKHALRPVTHQGRTELWHTRIEVPHGPKPRGEPTAEKPAWLRAIWSPDYNPVQAPNPKTQEPQMGRTAMSPNDRHQIVVLTSAFHHYMMKAKIRYPVWLPLPAPSPIGGARITTTTTGVFQRKPQLAEESPFWITVERDVPYVPQPFGAEQVMLSSLGGWLRSRGHWDPPSRPAQTFLRTRGATAVIGIDRDIIAARPATQTHATADARAARIVEPYQPLLTETNASLAAQLGAIGHLFPVHLPAEQLDLSEWVHHAAQGRDHYVKIVYEGELWPFRNRAALIKVTERKFERLDANRTVAYQMQRLFIVVREPEKTFAESVNHASPFSTIRLTTLITPDIADPDAAIPVAQHDRLQDAGSRTFWVQVMTGALPTQRARFQFHGFGIDKAGNRVDFTLPMMFVSLLDSPESIVPKGASVSTLYNGTQLADLDARAVQVGGTKLAFAPPVKAGNENTHLHTESLVFGVNPKGDLAVMLKADVRVPQLQELLGTDDPTTITWHDDYAANGFHAANLTNVFGQFAKAAATFSQLAPFAAGALSIAFSSDKSGGFATPNMDLTSLTGLHGPLAGDIADAANDVFDPTKFFEKGVATLFGTFDLADLILPGGLGPSAPKMTTSTNNGTVTTKLDWTPKVQPLDLDIAKFQPTDGGQLTVHCVIEKPIGAGKATSTLNGQLGKFDVTVLDSVLIHFTGFAFKSQNGSKANVDVNLDPAKPLEFIGDLEFVEEIRQIIPPGLFGAGSSLDVSPTGVRAGFGISLPPISVGVFALKDITLGASLTLPFVDGKPALDFNVSERAHPFQLMVSLFAGGGFFHLQLDTGGLRLVEASFEFGAACSLDVGVASGEVHVMAGIYFSLQNQGGGTVVVTLTGYLRIGGSLSVLGIVHVSIELYLAFTYRTQDKAYGVATLTIHVDILFFSIDFSTSVERQFSGSSNDPTFADTVTHGQWDEYALAFA